MSRALRLTMATLLGTCAGATVASCTCDVVEAAPPRSFGDTDVGTHPVAQYGLPSATNVVVKRGYISSLNAERRIPNWVMERVPHTKPTPKGAERSAPSTVSRDGAKFYADETVPEMFRATNADYTKRGISRGHLAPAQFHKESQEDMNETFNLSANIVPQDMTMNACDWYRLESMTKKLSRVFEKGLWVISGPLFVPIQDVSTGRRMMSYEVVGPHDVAVPTHLFKCLLGVREDGKKYQACFVMPNEPIIEEQPLTQYLVPASYVERTAGIRIFPKSNEGSGWAMAAPGDLCRNFKCEGSYAAFSKSFRMVGRVRAATTEGEVKLAYMQLYKEGAVDAAVEKELQAKLKELGVRDVSGYRANPPKAAGSG